MVRFFWKAVLVASLSACAFGQNSSTPSGAPASPANPPAAPQMTKPQSQMPPEKTAPPPTTVAPQTASQPEPGARYISSGAEIRATLDTPLSTRTAKPGDRFTATITQPVRDSVGNVVVPLGSKVNGQVGELTNDETQDAIKGMGHLDLRFTDIQLATGADIPLNAKLLSVRSAKGPHWAQGQKHAIISDNAAGIFGPPLKGIAVGNSTGGGYVLATKGKDVNIPADSGLLLRVVGNTPLP
ncbi:MAG TPA: hypothetical protein VFQ00_01560 [Terriglobales bacterium]|nr:hypothetical protein [Terriglobales bacterium]